MNEFTNLTINPDVVVSSMIGTGIIAFLIALGIIALFLVLGLYVYTSLAWMKIAQKAKHKHPWLAWIPFANIAMWLQMGGFHWAWIFLVFIPIFGWAALFVMFIIANWRVFEDLGYPGWFSMSIALWIIPKLGFVFFVVYLVSIGFAAWGSEKKAKIRERVVRKKSLKRKSRR